MDSGGRSTPPVFTRIASFYSQCANRRETCSGVLLMFVTQVLIQNVCSINTLIRESGHKSVQQVVTRNVKQIHEINFSTLKFITVVFISDIYELSSRRLGIKQFTPSTFVCFFLKEPTQYLFFYPIILHALTANNHDTQIIYNNICKLKVAEYFTLLVYIPSTRLLAQKTDVARMVIEMMEFSLTNPIDQSKPHSLFQSFPVPCDLTFRLVTLSVCRLINYSDM